MFFDEDCVTLHSDQPWSSIALHPSCSPPPTLEWTLETPLRGMSQVSQEEDLFRESPTILTPLTATRVSIQPRSVKYALEHNELKVGFNTPQLEVEFNNSSPALCCIPEISNSKIVHTKAQSIRFSTNQPYMLPLSATPKHCQENFLLSDLTVLRSDTATMEWHSLNSEWDLRDPNQQFTSPISDWSTDLLIDETLHNSDQNFDISELDEYLYPRSSSAQFNTNQTPPSFEEATDNEYVDPLSEFFPELIMPPSDQYVSSRSATLQHSCKTARATTVKQSFLETPCELETYCGDSNESHSSSVSEVHSSATPASYVGSTSSRRGVFVHNLTSHMLGSTSDYRKKRDKNNLSSQKSREKRRTKAQQLKEECSQLELRNVELKSSLDLLEKSVAEYKQIMLSFITK